MAIKFKDERIKTEVVIAREVVKDVVSGDIELKAHENGAQVNEVLDVRARVKDVKAVIVEGGIEINGVIQVDCLYNAETADSDDEKHRVGTYHQEAKIEFENFIDVPEAKPGMEVFLNIRVAEITYEVLETDVLEAAVTLIKYAAVSDVREITCLTHVSGLGREEYTEEQLRIEEWVGEEAIRATVAKEVELSGHSSEVEDILAVSGEIAKTEYRTMDNAVICDGIMEASIFYRKAEEDGKLIVIDERIEFDHVIDLYGTQPGMSVYGNYKLTDLSVQRISDDKARIVAQVECYVKVSKPRRLNVVTNILDEMVDTEKVPTVMEEVIGRNRVKDTIVHRINIPPTRPDVKRQLLSYCRVKDLSTVINNGGIVVEGSLEGSAFYTAFDDYLRGEIAVCLKDYFDFDSYIPVEDCEEGMDVYVEVEVKRTSLQVLNDRTLEMSVVLEKSVRVTNPVEVECVTDMVEISPLVKAENPPSYLIYVAQRGDTLEKIARRYKVNADALIEYNNLEDLGRVEVGQKITIPRFMIGAVG